MTISCHNGCCDWLLTSLSCYPTVSLTTVIAWDQSTCVNLADLHAGILLRYHELEANFQLYFNQLMELKGIKKIFEGTTAKDWLLMAISKCVHTENIVQVIYCTVSKRLFVMIQHNTLKSSNLVFLSSLPRSSGVCMDMCRGILLIHQGNNWVDSSPGAQQEDPSHMVWCCHSNWVADRGVNHVPNCDIYVGLCGSVSWSLRR